VNLRCSDLRTLVLDFSSDHTSQQTHPSVAIYTHSSIVLPLFGVSQENITDISAKISKKEVPKSLKFSHSNVQIHEYSCLREQ
jgi:hypothetical protein